MANGFIRHKVVQWVFDNKEELFSYTPKTEGVYALDNYYGDIYIFNGTNWMMYAKDAIKLRKNKKPQPDNYKRLYDLPQGLNPLASFHCDVNIYPSNFVANVNIYDDSSYVGYKSFISSSAFIDGTGYVVTASLSAAPPSGSFYTMVSMSIA